MHFTPLHRKPRVLTRGAGFTHFLVAPRVPDTEPVQRGYCPPKDPRHAARMGRVGTGGDPYGYGKGWDSSNTNPVDSYEKPLPPRDDLSIPGSLSLSKNGKWSLSKNI